MMSNYVPRTSFRWAPESHIGGNKEIKYEKKIERNDKGIRFYLYLYYIGDESWLFAPLNSPRLDF